MYIGKRSLKPYKIRLCNVSSRLQNKTKNLFTVAYGPVHQYTKQMLLKMLEKRVSSKANREGIALPYINRKIEQSFFRSVLGQLEATMFEPILLRVGRDLTKEPRKFVLLSPTFCNDNAECYCTTSVNMRSTWKRCRLCTVSCYTLCFYPTTLCTYKHKLF
jgi:hypothetical protein